MEALPDILVVPPSAENMIVRFNHAAQVARAESRGVLRRRPNTLPEGLIGIVELWVVNTRQHQQSNASHDVFASQVAAALVGAFLTFAEDGDIDSDAAGAMTRALPGRLIKLMFDEPVTALIIFHHYWALFRETGNPMPDETEFRQLEEAMNPEN